MKRPDDKMQVAIEDLLNAQHATQWRSMQHLVEMLEMLEMLPISSTHKVETIATAAMRGVLSCMLGMSLPTRREFMRQLQVEAKRLVPPDVVRAKIDETARKSRG